jgi:hypothetical protein
VQTEEMPLSYKARLVTLDYASGKTHTRLVLECPPARRAPERVWVWTYFFVPGGEREHQFWAGEPVEIKSPFTEGKRADIVADAACSWCNDARAPQEGFYARVHVSTESAASARLRPEELDYNLSTATPVVVEGTRRSSR